MKAEGRKAVVGVRMRSIHMLLSLCEMQQSLRKSSAQVSELVPTCAMHLSGLFHVTVPPGVAQKTDPHWTQDQTCLVFERHCICFNFHP